MSEPGAQPPIIEIDGLTKTYQVGDVPVHALRGVNLAIRKSEFVAIIGASGSGKSTLFHVLGGLTPATSGTVRINGRDLAGMTESERTDLRKATVGFVFQKYNLLPTLSAEDNIRIVQYIAGRDTAFNPAFLEVLRLLGIEDRMKHKPRALSGGEQQRVAMARGIVNAPSILLADEPTGNLDSENSAAVLHLMKDLNRRLGQTILMITHDSDAASYADRIVRMRDGCIV
jgi:putative ABC transport system ATP-binding protein